MTFETKIRWLDPARTVVERFATSKQSGFRIVAEITGVHVTRVYRWVRHKNDGGTNGLIPSQYQRSLLEAALERGINLSAEDVIGISKSGQQAADENSSVVTMQSPLNECR